MNQPRCVKLKSTPGHVVTSPNGAIVWRSGWREDVTVRILSWQAHTNFFTGLKRAGFVGFLKVYAWSNCIAVCDYDLYKNLWGEILHHTFKFGFGSLWIRKRNTKAAPIYTSLEKCQLSRGGIGMVFTRGDISGHDDQTIGKPRIPPTEI